MSLPGFWRLVEYGDDGTSVSEMLCCQQRTTACEHEIAKWRLCPFCGTSIIQQLSCRLHSQPAWAIKRGIDTYDIKWPERYRKSVYVLECQDRNGKWYTELGYLGHNRKSALENFRNYISDEKSGYVFGDTNYRLRFGSIVWQPSWAIIKASK